MVRLSISIVNAEFSKQWFGVPELTLVQALHRRSHIAQDISRGQNLIIEVLPTIEAVIVEENMWQKSKFPKTQKNFLTS